MSFGEFIGGWWSSDGGPTTPPDQSSFWPINCHRPKASSLWLHIQFGGDESTEYSKYLDKWNFRGKSVKVFPPPPHVPAIAHTLLWLFLSSLSSCVCLN
jgi:hypothetical protein